MTDFDKTCSVFAKIGLVFDAYSAGKEEEECGIKYYFSIMLNHPINQIGDEPECHFYFDKQGKLIGYINHDKERV